MALPKKQRLAQFDKLRKEGIIIYNRKIQGSKSDLMQLQSSIPECNLCETPIEGRKIAGG